MSDTSNLEKEIKEAEEELAEIEAKLKSGTYDARRRGLESQKHVLNARILRLKEELKRSPKDSKIPRPTDKTFKEDGEINWDEVKISEDNLDNPYAKKDNSAENTNRNENNTETATKKMKKYAGMAQTWAKNSFTKVKEGYGGLEKRTKKGVVMAIVGLSIAGGVAYHYTHVNDENNLDGKPPIEKDKDATNPKQLTEKGKEGRVGGEVSDNKQDSQIRKDKEVTGSIGDVSPQNSQNKEDFGTIGDVPKKATETHTVNSTEGAVGDVPQNHIEIVYGEENGLLKMVFNYLNKEVRASSETIKSIEREIRGLDISNDQSIKEFIGKILSYNNSPLYIGDMVYKRFSDSNEQNVSLFNAWNMTFRDNHYNFILAMKDGKEIKAEHLLLILENYIIDEKLDPTKFTDSYLKQATIKDLIIRIKAETMKK